MERDPETGAVLGAAIEVHRCLGRGFVESVYQEALALELTERGVPFQREVALQVRYKRHVLTSAFRADFVCYSGLILELKALDVLGPTEMSQVLNYLKATGYPKALLLNFGAPRLDFKRVILSTTASGVAHVTSVPVPDPECTL